MKISNLLVRQLIKVPTTAEDKEELFVEMVQQLISAGELPAARRAEAEKLLFDREAKMTTGVGMGLGLPHARMPELNHPLLALGIAPQGIEFGALDGKLVKVVMVIFTPENDPESHIQILTEISRLFMNAEMVQKLADCHDAAEVLTLIRSEEAR